MPEACIVCGAAKRRTIARYHTPDVYECAAGLSENGYWREWVACCNCSFHFSRHSRPDDFFDTFYERGYRSQSEWRTEDAYSRFRRISNLPKSESETHTRIDWVKSSISAFREWRTGSYEMIDIGGASGVFAALFQSDVWRSTVLDPADEGRFIEDKLGIPYLCQDLATVEVEPRFHLAAMNYVLEHLRDVPTALRKVRRILQPDGLLYIEVPDVSNFDALPEDHDIFNACHLWMFDNDTLNTILKESGFAICVSKVQKVLRGHIGLMVLAERIR